MKKKYLLTTEKTPDGVVYMFDEAGYFIGFEILQVSMLLNSRVVVMKNLHIREDEFLAWAKTIECTVIKLDDKITFDMFWDMYDEKRNGNRKRSLKLWDKLKEVDRVKAYHFYHTYMKNKPAGVGKKYPETYLAAELWNN